MKYSIFKKSAKATVAILLSFGMIVSLQGFTSIKTYANETGLQQIVPISEIEPNINSELLNEASVKSSWAYESIKFVVEKNLFVGLNGKFEPNKEMSRAMVVSSMAILSGNTSTEPSGFVDVPKDSIYEPYISWTSKSGVVEGVGGNRFAPDASVTREQLALLFNNYLKNMNAPIPAIAFESFKDESSISSWAKEAVNNMRATGLMEGKNNNTFDPKATASRAEVAKLVENLYNYLYAPVKTGEYSEERDLTSEDKVIFDEATKDYVGAKLEPLKVSTQVVAGMNYKFYTKLTPTTANATSRFVYVTVYKPLGNEKPTMSIEEYINTPIVGGFSEERDLTAEDKSVFEEATKDYVGAKLEPIKVATQVVAGMNYKFYTKLTPTTANATSRFVYVNINKPLGDEKTTMTIEEITETPLVGGFSEERDLTAEDKEIFEEVTKDYVGAKLEPIKVSTQVVAGMNYKFYIKLTPTTANATSRFVYVNVFKPLGDEKPTMSIEEIENK